MTDIKNSKIKYKKLLHMLQDTVIINFIIKLPRSKNSIIKTSIIY